jgi:Flp pilus assembly protein TadG
VLAAAALTLFMLLGILGLAIDLARMYVARNELQAYVDAASIAAATKLDGTSDGIDHARTVASAYPNRWNFGTATPSNITVTFADAPTGPYVSSPTDPDEVKYVQVSAQGTVTLYVMPGFSALTASAPSPAMLLIIGRQQGLQARAISGQFLVSDFGNGVLPYSPEALDPADKDNFGLGKGKMYTLRWPPKGQRDKSDNWCDGDEEAAHTTSSDANDRGYIDIAGNGAADIRDAIVNNAQTRPLSIGDIVVDVGGNRGTESDALRARVAQDSDTISITYSQYAARIADVTYNGPKGNGRRVVTVPIRNEVTNEVLGFGGFFLHTNVCLQGGDSATSSGSSGNGGQNSSVCCAEYIGPVLVPGRSAATKKVGAYRVKLFR